MKRIVTIFVVVFVLALALTTVPAAQASFGFEDPQLCVNGHLLVVQPVEPNNVFVSIPPGTAVDYNVSDCGGDATQPVVPAANVTFDGKKQMEVRASVAKHVNVTFSYNGSSETHQSGNGNVKAKFKLP
jgi:hypothetical protein